MKYNTILFDLDGTLSDSYEGITKAFQYALKHFGIEASQEQLRGVIGPTIDESMTKMWGIPEDKVGEAIAKYREHFTAKGIYENEMYAGVGDMVADLSERGARLVVASSKPLVFVKKILGNYGIDKYFNLIVGSELDGSRKHKVDIINYIIDELQIEDKSSVVMVGDRQYDLIGAQQAGIDCIGVLYGYAEEGELEQYSSVYLADTVKELHDYLIK